MPTPEEYQLKSDEELVIMTLADQEVFLYLMKRYESKLLRYVNRTFSTRNEDAEDIVQESFINAYRYLNSFDQRLKFSSWLYRIAHNAAVSYFRKAKARPQLIDSEDSDLILEKIASDYDLEQETHVKLTGEKVRDVLEYLDPKYREVLVLRYLENKEYQEISDILQKPIGTIGTLLNRAKKHFVNHAQTKTLHLEETV
ncbi:MAG: sigma-70 family RNA polymerase sigma factor [Patescibacteria group bacterium]|jgi:RNA polymerase sigma-70 factor (ECF subfamily)